MACSLSSYVKILVLVFTCILPVYSIITVEPGNPVTISLKTYSDVNINGQAFYKFTELKSSNPLTIKLIDVPSEVSFVIVQAHTQGYNITLSSQSTTGEIVTVSGANVGLEINSHMIDSSQINVINNNNSTTLALISVVAYTQRAPIPGRCSIDSKGKNPSQRSIVTDAMVIINAKPASAPVTNGQQLPCENNSVTYETYRLYVTERDFTNDSYFATIIKMLTVDNIINNGKMVPHSSSSPLLTTIYSAYPGVGSAYATIAKFGNHSTAYVPIFSYACDPLFNEESCYYLNTTIAKVLCASVLFIGAFLMFVGHKFFSGQIMILGMLVGAIIAYIGFSSIGIDSIRWHISGSLMIGLLIGILLLIIWLIMRMPCMGILQASLSLGALVASTTYFGMSDEFAVFKDDASFWAIYGVIMLLVLILLCILPLTANMICCAFLGAFGIILPIDYWLGSSLKYIIINTIRRMTVQGFNAAIIHPPIQSKDVWLCVFWLLLAFLTINKNRTSKYTIIESSGTRPLLSDQRSNRRVLPLRRTDVVYYT